MNTWSFPYVNGMQFTMPHDSTWGSVAIWVTLLILVTLIGLLFFFGLLSEGMKATALIIPSLLLFGGLSGAVVRLHSGYQKDQDNIRARQEYRDLVVEKVVDPLAENIAARGGILAGDNREYLIDSLTPIAVRGASLDERQDQWKEATITELPQFHITVPGFVDSCAVSSRSWDG